MLPTLMPILPMPQMPPVYPVNTGYVPTQAPMAKQNHPAERLFINMPGFEPDIQWAMAMNQVIEQSVAQLPQFTSAQALLLHLAGHYHHFKTQQAASGQTANPLNPYYNPMDTPNFGLLRNTGAESNPIPVEGRYQPYRLRAQALIGNSPGATHTAALNLGNTTLPLTTTVYSPQGLVWIPPSPIHVRQAMSLMEPLYQQTLALKPAMTNPAAQAQAWDNIATMHWLMVQAMPFARGTAGITDMMTKVLCDHLGLSTSSWKPGLAPDLEALVTPLDQFKANYRQFFQTPAFTILA